MINIDNATSHGQCSMLFPPSSSILILLQLSREDEASVGKDDLEVRREDQDKINNFSRLHQREMLLEDDLKSRAVLMLHFLSNFSKIF